MERIGATLMERMLALRKQHKDTFSSDKLLEVLGANADDSRYRWSLRRACQGDEAFNLASFSSIPAYIDEFKGQHAKPYDMLQARLGRAGPVGARYGCLPSRISL